MAKTKQQIQAYNKEYFSRPEVKEKLKIYNARPEEKAKRKAYKKTSKGKEAEHRYRNKRYSQVGFDKHLWQRYKITREIYEEMLKNQFQVCAICKINKNEKLHVDHCHSTLKIRGLLCGACNRALGLFKDNIELLNSAIKYLSNEIQGYNCSK